MPNFPSAAFSAMLKGVRKVQRNGIKPELKKKWVDALKGWDKVETGVPPNEFQLTEPLPHGPVSEIDWSVYNDEGLRLALKVRGVKGINSRWKRTTMIAKLIAIGD